MWEGTLVWVAFGFTGLLLSLLTFAFSSLTTLLAGLSPLLILLFGFLKSRVTGVVPKWPDQSVLPAFLFIVAGALVVRFEMTQRPMEIQLSDIPHWILLSLWLASLLCALASAFYYCECWGLVEILLIYTVFSMMCFHSAYAILDVRLDHQPPSSVESVRIIGKEIRSNGKTSHGSFKFAPTDNINIPSIYTANWDTYYHFQIGDSICFFNHRGALGTAWHRVGACPQPSK